MRFVKVTALSSLITLGLPVTLHEVLGLDPRIAIAVALMMAFFVNFALVRRYVFKSKEKVLPEAIRFGAMSLSFRLGEYVTFLTIYEVMELNYIVSFLGVQGTSVLLKYAVLDALIYRSAVWRENPEEEIIENQSGLASGNHQVPGERTEYPL